MRALREDVLRFKSRIEREIRDSKKKAAPLPESKDDNKKGGNEKESKVNKAVPKGHTIPGQTSSCQGRLLPRSPKKRSLRYHPRLY